MASSRYPVFEGLQTRCILYEILRKLLAAQLPAAFIACPARFIQHPDIKRKIETALACRCEIMLEIFRLMPESVAFAQQRGN